MGLLKQIRSLFVSIGLAVFISGIMILGTGSGLAAIAFDPIVSQTRYIATTSQDNSVQNIKGKAQEVLGKLTGNQKTESAGKEKQFKAKTLEGINNSLVNPNYKPSGESDLTENLARQTTEDVENQIRGTFK
ncbi:CsbD family protein [Pseudanabaena sp. UWO310]|uniref:CsbD family protein n=1 Tax=Pseudanabaena sp. UWO310 TaxID=2480795 RepID=UPI001680AD81|nr:CsbD family protein [Pseudanabaena sp. UWO310]